MFARRRHALFAPFIFALIALIPAQPANAESRLKLWEIISEQCIPNQQANQNPAPCVEVNLTHGTQDGYVVFPDRNGVAQFLLMPTRRITGIEDPVLLQPGLPNYWQAAWQARHYMFDKLGKNLPWDAIGLAVNSQPSRSQDQFHIHIDCLAPQVRDQLRQHAAEIGTGWSKTNFDLMGHRYRARRVDDLNKIQPFINVIDELGVEPSDMGRETLIIVGSVYENRNGFILLEDHADAGAGDPGHGEDLLDAACGIIF